MKKQALVMIGIVVVVVGIGWLLLNTGGAVQSPQSLVPTMINDLVVPETHMTGSTSAKVNLVEFGDYECPACGAVHPALKKVVEEYKGNPNFNFSFRNFPLSQHVTARPAAYAAEAAAKQSKFWEMHDMLYERQSELERKGNASDIFAGYAQQLGMNVDQFKSDMNSDSVRAAVDRDLADANRLDLNHTPTLYMNGVDLDYLPSYDQFKKLIEVQLEK